MPRLKAADSTGAQVVDAASVVLSGRLVDVRVVQIGTLERVAVPSFCSADHTFPVPAPHRPSTSCVEPAEVRGVACSASERSVVFLASVGAGAGVGVASRGRRHLLRRRC